MTEKAWQLVQPDVTPLTLQPYGYHARAVLRAYHLDIKVLTLLSND